MSFASPLWLLAALGLLVPLVLHLLARGRGRRVRVGSVRLLSASPPRRPRRLQLQRPLLLALRCALLALVTLALAGPRLRREAEERAAPRPWVLVEPAVAMRTGSESLEARPVAADVQGAGGAADEQPTAAAGVELPPAVRKAIAAGAEVHLLAPGLPPASAVRDVSTLPDVATVAGGTWSLLREAAATAPPGTRLIVVSGGRLAAFRGERPTLTNVIEWHELPDARVNRWPVRVLAASSGATLLAGESDATRTSFASRPLASPVRTVALPSGDAVAGDDRLALSPARPFRVAVLAAPDRAADARYVRAALAASAESAGVTIELDPGARDGAAAAPAAAGLDAGHVARLVFWLGDAAPPPSVLAAAREGATLVTDGSGSEDTCLGSFVAVASTAPVAVRRCAAGPGGGSTASASVDHTTATPPRSDASRRASEADVSGSTDAGSTTPADTLVLWRTDTGRALLTAQPRGDGRWLRFASRFHPAWSDLVLSPALPEWLRDVLLEAAGANRSAELPASDRRRDGGQGRPARAAAQHHTASASPPPSPTPEHVAWLLLFPLLVAERWLAARR